jgi:pimeloyl-ACP methyl ester carboxylesterase
MSTFVLIHGAGDVGWSWHLVEAELRARGHDVVAPDLPGDDDELELEDYADAVVAAVGDRRDLVVVGHSFGGFTASLVAARLPVDALVFVTAMIPAPGESPGEWWERTGLRRAVEEQAAREMPVRAGGSLADEEDADVLTVGLRECPREAERVVAALGAVGWIVQDEVVFAMVMFLARPVASRLVSRRRGTEPNRIRERAALSPPAPNVRRPCRTP